MIGVLKLALMQSRPQTTIRVPLQGKAFIDLIMYADYTQRFSVQQIGTHELQHPKRENPSWEENLENQ
jgi:hypothetical protein